MNQLFKQNSRESSQADVRMLQRKPNQTSSQGHRGDPPHLVFSSPIEDCSKQQQPSLHTIHHCSRTAECSPKHSQGTNKDPKCPHTVSGGGRLNRQTTFQSGITVLYMSRPGCAGLATKCGMTNSGRGLSRCSWETCSSCRNGLVRGQRGNSSVHKITDDRKAC